MKTPQLPVETWTMIAQKAAPVALPSLALTCHTLNNVVRPFLFRNMSYVNVSSGGEPWREGYTVETYIARERRMSDWLRAISTHFAEYVRSWNFMESLIMRECDITFTDYRSEIDDDIRDLMFQSNQRLHSVFIRLLPTFTRLTKLDLWGLPLDDELLGHIERLPALVHLECLGIHEFGPFDRTVTINAEVVMLQLDELLRDLYLEVRRDTHSPILFNSNKLRNLQISNGCYFAAVILAGLTGPPFVWSHLSTLHVDIGEKEIRKLSDFLDGCPQLENLDITDRTNLFSREQAEEQLGHFPLPKCPRLRAITSSSLFLINLVPGRPVETVEVTGYPGELEIEFFSPRELLEALSRSTARKGVRSLVLNGGKRQHIKTILRHVAHYLPNLTEPPLVI